MANGFLVVGNPRVFNDILYYGIDTEPWPVAEENLHVLFNNNEFDKFEEMTNDLMVCEEKGGLIDLELMKRYVEYCLQNKYEFRILYVESDFQKEKSDDLIHYEFANKKCFLGYDVGICAYNYYSSLLSDVIARPSLLGSDVFERLNQFGLFNTIEDVNFYNEKRNIAKKIFSSSEFEKGDMRVWALYNVNWEKYYRTQ